MRMRWTHLLAALALAAPAHAQTPSQSAAPIQSKAPAKDARNDCFYITQLNNDVPINNHAVLMRVNVSDVYELDFAGTCPYLTYPDPKLILTPVGGIGLICHALDLDVSVGLNGGPGDIPVPCIPSALRRLTPAEVAALPKKDRP